MRSWLSWRRATERSAAFPRDSKRAAQGKFRATLDGKRRPVLLAVAIELALGARCRAVLAAGS